MNSTDDDDATPTTSYKSEIDDDLPPTPTPNASVSQCSPKSYRRHNRSSSKTPTADSLLPEEENKTNENETPSNDQIGEFNDNGKRATITAMICRKSKAFLFGQMLSLFLVSEERSTCSII